MPLALCVRHQFSASQLPSRRSTYESASDAEGAYPCVHRLGIPPHQLMLAYTMPSPTSSLPKMSAPAMISACLCLRSHIPAPNLPFLFFPFECPRASPAVLLRCRRADVGPTVPLRLAGVLLQGARARRAQAALRRGSRRGWRRGSQRRSQRGWRRGWRRGCEASSDGGA